MLNVEKAESWAKFFRQKASFHMKSITGVCWAGKRYLFLLTIFGRSLTYLTPWARIKCVGEYFHIISTEKIQLSSSILRD